ncbi:N-(5'-phosphoribosyl)anthranilate isomerase [Stieleria neptunia]|uniref:N-(5'-phosphoribosyl)anthranilate isomerase n=2 Tax=Stieleria neptunia TaxID=2527979 RepID=A0A518HR88_9BACT|nr:N-(5'-phosphoribosyl)anthranilate isomerase [Stieleria neptunia]
MRAVERSGGDAIGLNFFPNSVRYVDPQSPATGRLSRLANELGLLRVGVFVNESAERMAAIAATVGLDAIQLHGDEPIESAESLRSMGWPVLRAIKLPRGGFAAALMQERSAAWVAAGCHLLLDVDAGSAHGGSGKTLDWPSVAAWAQGHRSVGWTLAGGLKPENVRRAIEATGAVSVDTASGVECPRGVKDESRIRAFIAAATG